MDKVGSFWKGALAGAAALLCIHASQGEMPARYVPLDWVEASGAQWVMTDYVPQCTDRFEISLRTTSSGNTQCLYCSRGVGTGSNACCGFIINGSSFRFDRNASQTSASYTVEKNADYVVSVDYGTRECKVNGETVLTMSNTTVYTPGSLITLFASHTGGMALSPSTTMGNWAYYRFFYFRVYNAAGKLVREYVPALDSEAVDVISKCGVFETQTGVFLPNIGTQPFKSVGRADSTITLESDEDWSSLGAERYGKTIDLNGHNLRLGAIDAPAVVTNSAVTVGELRLDLAESVTNSLMHVQGNVKLVKSGVGAYAAALDNQLYTGGLDIREGMVMSMANGSSHRMGAAGGEIHVGTGAWLDMRGTIDHAADYKFFLDGGTVTSSVSTASAWTKAMIADVRVGADSVIDTGSSVYGILNGGYALAPLDLGGHTLSIRSTGTFYIVNTTATAGTLILNGITEFYHGESSDFTAANVIVNGQLRLNSNCGVLKLGDCTFNTAAADTSANYTQGIQVYGTLRPNTDYFHGCEMQNGSTLDLRGRDAVFNTMGKNIGATAAMTTITFAADAAVKIDLRGRQLAEGMCLMRWPAKPADTVTFSFDDETAAAGIAPFVADDGLYYGGGETAAYPNTATWTGAAGDGDIANPANWACVNQAGAALANALPGKMTDVVLTGDFAFNVPPGASLEYGRILCEDARLSADCDWRGLGAAKIDGTLDLNSHTLRVAGLDGDGAITSSFDLTKPEAERATSTTTFYNGVAANLFSNNFERQVDAVHRVISTYANLPIVVDYDFGEATLVTAYKIHFGPVADSELQRAPKAWTFSGSDDGENWTVLDERTSETGWTHWECRTFTFQNSTAYRRYRISITDSVLPSNGYVEFVQLEYGLAESGFGTVRFEVPAGEVAVLNARIDGNVRLVKEGEGEMLAKKARQTYNMGTEIAEGNVRFGTGDAPLGRSKVKIGAGARLDVDSYYNTTHGTYNLDLAGTLSVTNGVVMNTFKFGNITLSGDATILGSAKEVYFSYCGVAPGILALNGHTLTFSSNGFVALGQWVDDGSGGKLVFTGDGARFETTASGSYGPAGLDVMVTGGAVLKEFNNYNIGGLTYDAAKWQLNSTACKLLVNGVFRPDAMYPALTMCNGSTLDLSQKTDVWNSEGVPAVAGTGNPREYDEPGLVSFAEGATVKVDVHGRSLAQGDMIVSWTEKPTGVTFVFDDATAAAGVAPIAGNTGLFYGNAGAVEVATWTGAAGDGNLANPANWSCVDIAGAAVQNGLPHSGAIVHIAGTASLQAPAADSLPCAKVVFDDFVLAADCDLRGLDLSTAEGSVDLAGHKLYVSSIGGAFTITDRRGYEILDYVAVPAGAWVNTGYTPNCTDRMQAKVRLDNTSGNKNIYCSRTQSGKNIVRTFSCFAIGSKFRFDRNAGTVNASPTINTTTDYELDANGATLRATVNGGSAVNMPSGDFTPGSALVLFASHTSAPGTGVDNKFVGRCYYFRIYNKDGVLLHEYLPARRINDGAAGLLDTCTGTLLQSGTGTLTVEGNVGGYWGTDPGELHVDVPEGKVVENYGTVITGNLKLFKEGEGELVGGISGQIYCGGTVIAGGLARPRQAINDSLTYYEAQHFWGGDSSSIVIGEGATFDIAGHYAYRVHNIVLNGGTLANYGPDQTNTGYGGIGNLTLTADSVLDIPYSTSVYCPDMKVDLGGHTLTVNLGEDKTMWVGEPFQNGTLELVGKGYFRPTNIALDMSTVDLRLSGGASVWIGQNVTVRDFFMDATDLTSRGVLPINALRWYSPQGDGCYGTVLHNGAVLDLSRMRGELPARMPNVLGCDTTTYEAEASITIHLVGRVVRNGERIVAWDSPPANVTFVLDDESRSASRCSIIVQEDGIYVRKGLLIYFR